MQKKNTPNTMITTIYLNVFNIKILKSPDGPKILMD